MAHIALICPFPPGHQHPMNALGRELQRRGHRVTAFQLADGAARARAAGLEVVLYGEQRFPPGTAETILEEIGRMSGLRGVQRTFALLLQTIDVVLDELPDRLRAHGVELVLADEAAAGGGSAAEAAGLPWVAISNALLVRLDPACPPIATTFQPSTGALARLRDGVANLFFFLATWPMRLKLWRARARHGLPNLGATAFERATLLHLCQEPAPFAFPRAWPGPEVHMLGPFHDEGGRKAADFPWDRLDGRPLVYASLGTIQNRLQVLFQAVAAAAAPLPVQLVISLGDSCDPDALGPLPGDPVVVRWAPQQALLARAAACVTHAGLNTALECLSLGVPMVALPITNDQPGVAARIARCGAGLWVPPRPDPKAIGAALRRVLDEPSFRASARRMAEHITEVRPRERAADLIEELLYKQASQRT